MADFLNRVGFLTNEHFNTIPYWVAFLNKYSSFSGYIHRAIHHTFQIIFFVWMFYSLYTDLVDSIVYVD